MSESVYQCRDCGAIITGTVGKYKVCSCGVNHWLTLGYVGDVSYTCSKCSATVQTKYQPASQGKCPCGGYHSWKKDR